jgi:hypothetical protein
MGTAGDLGYFPRGRSVLRRVHGGKSLRFYRTARRELKERKARAAG